LITTILLGCSTKPLEIKTTPIEITKPRSDILLPPVKPIHLGEVTWTVDSSKVCVNETGYSTILNNTIETLNYIKKSDYKIEFYENQIKEGSPNGR
jgi:hypothetical protein